jgi:hypothetical protein
MRIIGGGKRENHVDPILHNRDFLSLSEIYLMVMSRKLRALSFCNKNDISSQLIWTGDYLTFTFTSTIRVRFDRSGIK